MQTDSLPSLSHPRVSKRIRKLKTDLHLTLTKPKSMNLRLKLPLQSLFQSSSKHPTFLSSLMYFPAPLRKLLKDKARLIREDVDGLCETLPQESDKPIAKELQDMRLVMRNQDQRLQDLCKETLQDSAHDTLKQYLNTLVSRNSPLNMEESIETTNEGGFQNENYHLGQVFNEESLSLNSVKGLMQRSLGSGVSLNETTQEGGSKENSFEVFSGFRENAKFYWRETMTPSTTPNTSKRNSPIFSEKKNLLLSSKIEDIINEGDEIFCRRFEDENLSFEDGMEEKQMNFDFFLKGQEPETIEKFDEDFGGLKKINESIILADNDNLPFF